MPLKPARQLPAERLLKAASELFLRQGIRAVGIDRILAEANTARASLYQTYGSKDALVVAYMEQCDERDRAAFQQAVRGESDPISRILMIFDLDARTAPRNEFRGCSYGNAVTEFPERDHPVHTVVDRHRKWILDAWTRDLAALGVPQPAKTAEELLLLHDGGLRGSQFSRSVKPIRQAKDMAAELIARQLQANSE
ncbi:TetR/AcrR family transcriptional regulator [Streptomyces sp. NBC_01571]|uniref:TetR/AcrR family transcriptional regulator n=1 Tax=Streptomyces sp. NBC_01571 TaxID=2975883 RepID=UPI002259216F|nr:TetR/AcrR family transcriptional regulator [Streptomyces sp. NBC_01571]MCX4580593.1 TetR/AcrR family transcriptional regulator [Streptomyces sp. NBC_01571]